MAMIAQKSLLRAGASVLALAGIVSKLNSKFSEEGSNKAKKGYEKAVNTKKENKELTNKNIQQVIDKKVPQSFGELARTEEEIPVESKVVENKTQIKGFTGAADNTAQPKQKYILSEEGAYFPIKAEHTETKIPVDEDVKGLIEVKQKNLKRSAAASKARTAYIESKAYEADFPIRDYMPDVSDAELKKAGLTKTDLNKLGSILSGNGNEADVQNWFKEHGAEDLPESGVINFGSLRVQEEAANAIKSYIIDKNKYDVNAQEEYDLSKAEPEEENYKVWQDEIQETNRNFDGIVF